MHGASQDLEQCLRKVYCFCKKGDQAVDTPTVRGTNERSNDEMRQTHDFLIEGRLTLADIAIIPFIRQIMRTREGEFDFASYPKVLAWTNGLVGTVWFQNVVIKK